MHEFVVHAFKIAHVMGVHFSAGEWGSFPRCGSVVTCVINRRSVYGRVSRFLRVEGDDCPGYAVVEWFCVLGGTRATISFNNLHVLY